MLAVPITAKVVVHWMIQQAELNMSMEKDNGSGYTLTYQEAQVLRDVKEYFENDYLPLWPSEETINNSVENYAKNIKNLKKCVDTAITEWLNPALGLKDPEDKNCNDSL